MPHGVAGGLSLIHPRDLVANHRPASGSCHIGPFDITPSIGSAVLCHRSLESRSLRREDCRTQSHIIPYIKPHHNHSGRPQPKRHRRPTTMRIPNFSHVHTLQALLENPGSTELMCTEHTADCPVCGKEYLIFVEFCHEYHPPLLACPRGKTVETSSMEEGLCPSPVCPNSITGGCAVI